MYGDDVLGGGKIWECTQDLGDFLTRSAESGDGDDDEDEDDNGPSDQPTSERQPSLFADLNGLHVLDLGCGAGILGLLALRAGATVHFQDYVSILYFTLFNFHSLFYVPFIES